MGRSVYVSANAIGILPPSIGERHRPNRLFQNLPGQPNEKVHCPAMRAVMDNLLRRPGMPVWAAGMIDTNRASGAEGLNTTRDAGQKWPGELSRLFSPNPPLGSFTRSSYSSSTARPPRAAGGKPGCHRALGGHAPTASGANSVAWALGIRSGATPFGHV